MKNAVNVVTEALPTKDFRNKLFIQLKSAQETLLTNYSRGRLSQQAIDKAHEINYLLDTLLKMGL